MAVQLVLAAIAYRFRYVFESAHVRGEFKREFRPDGRPRFRDPVAWYRLEASLFSTGRRLVSV